MSLPNNGIPPEQDTPAADKEEIYRNAALNKFMSPDQLDQLLAIVNPKGWIALILMMILVVLIVAWAFWGTIPITVAGRGIILPAEGYIDIQSDQAGTLVSLNVKPGDHITTGQQVGVLATGASQQVALYSHFTGTLMYVSTNVGDYIQPGKVLFWLENGSDDKTFMNVYFPADMKANLHVGQIFSVRCADNSTAVFQGKISMISDTAVTQSTIANQVHAPALAQYLSQSLPSLIQAKLDLLQPATSGSKPAINSNSSPAVGSPCIAQDIAARIRPIDFVLPLATLQSLHEK